LKDPYLRFDPWTRVNNWAVDELTNAGSRRTTAVNTAAALHAALRPLSQQGVVFHPRVYKSLSPWIHFK